MSDHLRNTDGLKKYIQQKSQEKENAVDEAIRRLIKEQRPVIFNSVANEASVTKAHLYGHQNLRDRIEQLRSQHGSKQNSKAIRQDVSNGSKDIIIAAKTKGIRELEDENKRLKGELEVSRGKIYDNV